MLTPPSESFTGRTQVTYKCFLLYLQLPSLSFEPPFLPSSFHIVPSFLHHLPRISLYTLLVISQPVHVHVHHFQLVNDFLLKFLQSLVIWQYVFSIAVVQHSGGVLSRTYGPTQRQSCRLDHFLGHFCESRTSKEWSTNQIDRFTLPINIEEGWVQ